MNTFTSILALLVGISLRLLLPLALTVLVVVVLRRLDTRWQAEAEREKKMLLNGEAHCWKEEGYSSSEIKQRLQAGERPCWQSSRMPNGHLREECLDCEVFQDAPVPVSQRHVHV
jgi:hypothetical protein